MATGYACVSALLFVYTASKAFRLIDLRLTDFFRTLSRPAAATLTMVGVLLSIDAQFGSWPATWRLGIGIVVGVIAFSIAILIMDGERVAELNRIRASLRGRNPI